jgi:hypothetical protein
LFGNSPLISRSAAEEFPAYIREKYPEHVRTDP